MSAEFPASTESALPSPAPTPAEAAAPLPIEPPLSVLEARVLGCLIEKELATPDVYPLTLNALVNACNQRNNRAPLLSAGASEVEVALEHLRHKQLVTFFAGAEARVKKFKQRLDAEFPMETPARAMIAELLLRGPQTSAGLRGNAERMCAMPDLGEIDTMLGELAARPAGPLVRKLPRQPGQKEARWVQLFTGEPPTIAAAELSGPAEPLVVGIALPAEAERRLAALEAEIAALKHELAQLRESLGGG
ncbi:YceH family protein [Horticoccus luteus]|uniref:YceH family protein n=1 Tax=Horticoccus luteus TaxID=2862869 RepID=A0A8F9TWB0_9BACT|nr:YceH family protein [Horticoccus luteus]QYM80429.1 YceH family protein [Horticoccus luteus]